MIEITRPQPANLPWEPSAPAHSFPAPTLSPFTLPSRPVETEEVTVAVGRHQLLEIAVERGPEFRTLPTEVMAALRAGIIEPQRAAVQRGKGSAISLASLLLQCGDIEGAKVALADARDEYWALHLRAMCAWQGGDLKTAEDLLRALAGRHADDARPLHALGKLLSEQARLGDAADVLRAAVTKDPESPSLLNDLGAVLIAMEKYREALQAFRAALRHAPTYSLALANSGVAHFQLGHKSKAASYFRRALAVDPQCVAARHNLAECLLERNDLEGVGKLLASYIERAPRDARAHELLAWSFLSSKRFRDAQRVLESGSRLRANRDPSLLNNLAMVYSQLGELPRAQAAFQSAILLAPENSQIRANFAHFLATLEQWARVTDVLRTDDVDGVADRAALLAQAFFETSEIEKAVLVLRGARERFLELRFDLMLGHALASRLGRPEEAIVVYQDALQRHSDDLLMNNLGYALILAGRLREARAVLEPVYARMGARSDTTALCTISSFGLLQIREGNFAHGIALYREAHGRAAGSLKKRIKQKINVEEGAHYVDNGQLNRGRAALKAALLGPDPEFSSQAEHLLTGALD